MHVIKKKPENYSSFLFNPRSNKRVGFDDNDAWQLTLTEQLLRIT
jgi:hypothetical protein